MTACLDDLADDEFGHAERYIDLLADQGALLGEPFTRQLDGKLRELRFYLGRQQTRMTCYGRRAPARSLLDDRANRPTVAAAARATRGMSSGLHGRDRLPEPRIMKPSGDCAMRLLAVGLDVSVIALWL